MKPKTLFTAGFAACAFVLSATAALAAPMTVTSDATIQDGDSHAIGAVSKGSTFDVEYCSGAFCLGTGGGVRGWIPQNQLAGGAPSKPPAPPAKPPAPPAKPPAPPQNPLPNFSFEFGFGNQPNFPRPGQPPRPPRPRNAEVCFYEQPNFRGQSFCVRAGDSDRSLSRRWNDSISSVRVDRGLVVLVCRDRNFRGGCAEIDSDLPRLNRFDNAISSYRVEFD